jgi:glycosyltransferase 2 family protein
MNKRAQQFLLRGFYVAAGAAIVVLLFKDVDVDAVTRAVTGIGYSFIGVVTIYLIGCVFDVAGWRRLMPSSCRSISFFRLLAVHIAGESYYRFIPGGAVIGDSVKVILSRSIFHIDSSQAVSSLVLRKIFMGIAQVFYIGLAVFLGIFLHGTATAGSLQLAGGILASALFAMFFSMALWIRKGTLCVSVFALLMKVPSDTFRQKLSAQKPVFIETDVLLRDVLQNRRSDVLTAVVFFLGNWLTELIETLVILALLGAAVPITGAMLFEPVISLVRSIAFIFPGGLGIMDAGYVSALRMYGIQNAAVVAAAFIVIKRSKELVWIIIGISLTMILGRNGTPWPTKFILPQTAAETA